MDAPGNPDPAAGHPRGPRLRLVCVNDVYTLEHLPSLATLAARERADDPEAVLITTLAGDFMSPSVLSSLDGGRGMIDCLNAVPITHACLGNHEDDLSIDELKERIAEFRGVFLSTNVLELHPKLQTAAILDVGRPGGRSVRVGLIGVVMDDLAAYRAAPFGGAKTLPPNATALAATKHLLEQEGCAVVVPLTHQPADADRELARLASPPFPVIVGGHEHVVDVERIESQAGARPGSIGETWLVKAGADAVHAVVIDLDWPHDAPTAGDDRPTARVRIEDVARYPEDASLRARVDAHMACVAALDAATLMVIPPGETLSSVGTRARQTSLGTLIASLLRDALGADAAIVNGGGLRGARDHVKRFTYGDLRAEVPFDNEAVVAEIPGSVLADAVAASRARAPIEAGGFLQLDDRMAADGAHGVTLTRVADAPLELSRVYRVALVRNLFDGMDHVEPLVRFAKEHPDAIPQVGSGREVKLVLLEAFSRALFRKLGSFESLDTNQDGSLDAEEIAAAVARVTCEPASKLTVDLLMKAYDADCDDKLSRGEAT